MPVINYLNKVILEHGALRFLAEECHGLDIHSPLIVTDRGIRDVGILDIVLEKMREIKHVVFDETPPNPNEAAVRAAIRVYQEHGCDGVIAVGGGSSIDLGKGVAVCATHDGPLQSFAYIEAGLARITRATAPVIAVPTTAGTGSEVGRGAMLILDDGRKVSVISPHVIPKVAICDPDLTMGLPAFLTAATGMDAIAHCMETFMSPLFNPPADGIAIDGLRRAWMHIETAVRAPSDRSARLNMMSASMQGALAFQKGLGCVHSMSHAIGALNPKLHHGTLNAILLPAVIAFNASAPSMLEEDRMARMAHAMGLDVGLSVDKAVKRKCEQLGLPTGLGALGVEESMFPAVVEGALHDHCHPTNPRTPTASHYMTMLAASM